MFDNNNGLGFGVTGIIAFMLIFIKNGWMISLPLLIFCVVGFFISCNSDRELKNNLRAQLSEKAMRELDNDVNVIIKEYNKSSCKFMFLHFYINTMKIWKETSKPNYKPSFLPSDFHGPAVNKSYSTIDFFAELYRRCPQMFSDPEFESECGVRYDPRRRELLILKPKPNGEYVIVMQDEYTRTIRL